MFKELPYNINQSILDVWGEISYPDFHLLILEQIQLLTQEDIVGKRVVLTKENDRYLLAITFALLENSNEVMMLEHQSQASEIKAIIEYYDIDYSLSFIGNRLVIQKTKKNASHVDIQEGKLYYFSSGSTGIPKAFGYTSNQLIDLLQTWINHLNISATDCTLCPLSITHFHGTIISFSALLTGSKLLFLNHSVIKSSNLIDLLFFHKPTIISGVPFLYQYLLQSLSSGFKGFDNIRYAICGSAPMTVDLAEKFFNKFNICLNQGYGLSEIGAICLDLHPEIGLGSVGKVILGINYKIIDKDGQPVRQGEEGELIVQSSFMTKEYLNDEEATRESYIDGWLHTKDIVKEDNLGRITILGRISTFINISGFKVYPIEIEKVIASYKEGLSVAVKEQTDSNATKIIAYIEKIDDLNVDQLRQYCQENLAKYKWPSEYKVVKELPKNAIGKVRYNLIT